MRARIGMFVMAGAVSLAVCGAARAAIITWQPVQPITGESNVSTLGTLERAYNFGAEHVSATTVNGVTFAPFSVASVNYWGEYSVSSPDGLTAFTTDVGLHTFGPYLYGLDALGYDAAPFTNLSASYKALLGSALLDNRTIPMAMVLDGLTVGQGYLFEAWASDSRDIGTYGARYDVFSAGASSGEMDYNGVGGSVGQYVIGTFTANSSEQWITISGDFQILNAFELRMIPEPSTVLLLGVGGLLLWRRKQALRA